jgi:hypothetical protein
MTTSPVSKTVESKYTAEEYLVAKKKEQQVIWLEKRKYKDELKTASEWQKIFGY